MRKKDTDDRGEEVVPWRCDGTAGDEMCAEKEREDSMESGGNVQRRNYEDVGGLDVRRSRIGDADAAGLRSCGSRRLPPGGSACPAVPGPADVCVAVARAPSDIESASTLFFFFFC